MPSEPDAGSPGAGADLHRLHPLSLLFRIAASLKLLLVPLLLVFVAGRDNGEPWWIGFFVLPGLIHSVLHYVTFRYGFDGDELVVRGGLLLRNERHIPYARIHNVDLTQGPFHRIFGVADVRIETAGGAEPEARLQVLSLAAVDAMRGRVFGGGSRRGAQPVGHTAHGRDALAVGHEAHDHDAHGHALAAAGDDAHGHAATGHEAIGAAGADPRDGAAARASEHDAANRQRPAPASRRLLRLGARDLLLFGLISNRGMAVVLAAFGLAHEFDLFSRFEVSERFDDSLLPDMQGWAAAAALAGLVLGTLVLLRLLSIVWAALHLGGFELERSGDDLRSRAGLITRVSATIPRHRIQVLTITESLLHRVFGRVAVKVDTAGGDSLERASQSTRRWLAPLLRRDQLDALLDEVQPGLRLADVHWRPVDPRAERRLAKRWVVLAGLAAVAAGALLLLRDDSLLGSRLGLVLGGAVLAAGLGRLDARVRARRLQWSLDQSATWTRRGVWTRTTRVVRDRKAQVVALGSTPFDRRWGMARVVVDAAGSDEPVSLSYLPAREADALLARLTRRVADTAFRW